MKLQPFSLTVLFAANIIWANDQLNIEPLDEDFLEFIANMSVIDGEIIDSLDMLDIADNDMKSKTNLDDDFNSKPVLDKTIGLPEGNLKKEEQTL